MTEALAPLAAASLSHPRLAHGFFTRQGGVSTGMYAGLNCGPGSDDDPAAVAENRRRIQGYLGATALLSCWQVHGAEVVTVTEPGQLWSSEAGRLRANAARPRADGMVTNLPGIALGILTADCGPVLLADAQAGVIGACHAGWKGAHGGVIAATVAAMEALGAQRSRIAAALGPCIAPESYEVTAGFRDTLLQDRPEALAHFTLGKPGHFQFDLKGFIAARFAELGIARSEVLPQDTYADETRFYSYRRTTHRAEPDYGRQISAIMLR